MKYNLSGITANDTGYVKTLISQIALLLLTIKSSKLQLRLIVDTEFPV